MLNMQSGWLDLFQQKFAVSELKTNCFYAFSGNHLKDFKMLEKVYI
jgi:hypothetical protein